MESLCLTKLTFFPQQESLGFNWKGPDFGDFGSLCDIDASKRRRILEDLFHDI